MLFNYFIQLHIVLYQNKKQNSLNGLRGFLSVKTLIRFSIETAFSPVNIISIAGSGSISKHLYDVLEVDFL